VNESPVERNGLEAVLDRLLDIPSSRVGTDVVADEGGERVDVRSLGELLAAAAAPVEPGPQAGELAALEAFRTLVPSAARPARGRFAARALASHSTAARIAAAATGALVLLGGGVAAAATGSLPGAAQQTAHRVLAAIGVHVPGQAPAAGTHPDQRGDSSTVPGASEATPSGSPSPAPSPASTVPPRGAAVSATASRGHSHAGRHSSSTAPGRHVASSHAPVPTGRAVDKPSDRDGWGHPVPDSWDGGHSASSAAKRSASPE
jgi:hypothetical protein